MKLQDGLSLSMHTWLGLLLGTVMSHVQKVCQCAHTAARCNHAALSVYSVVPISSCADKSIQINLDALCADILYIYGVYVYER